MSKSKRPQRETRTHQVDERVSHLSEVYYMSLDCPRALTAYMLLKYGEYGQLVALRADPNDYDTADRYWLAACASDWLRKYPGLPGYNDNFREEMAKASWYQSEMECGRTNSALQHPGVVLAHTLEVAADWFADLIGPFPCDLAPYFGPGATMSDPARAVTVLDKVSSHPSMTSTMAPLLQLWRGTAWERSHLSLCNSEKTRPYPPKLAEGNVFFTVPKDALTFRGCAKGPSLNVAYQLGAGKAIRQNLKRRFGYDIDAKQFEHGLKACEGSLTNALSTIDSSRASDCMSTKLVEVLTKKVPLWHQLLLLLREQRTHIDDVWIELSKFSAMGNGFTFELETLVFLSLSLAIATLRDEDPLQLLVNGDISVYGDDVIVPTSMAPEVMNLLSACGFTVNARKSFLSGNFRESCGHDYFNGVRVNTPKLEKEIVDVAGWFSVHNKLYGRVMKSPLSSYMSRQKDRLLLIVKDQLPRRYRSMYGPEWLGDKVLHGWYGPQITTKARRVLMSKPEVGPPYYEYDPNQWVGSLEVLTPIDNRADFEDYSDDAQLAYVLYTRRSDPPVRRPTRKLRYRTTIYEGDYHVLFMDEKVGYPRWLTKSPRARDFGL